MKRVLNYERFNQINEQTDATPKPSSSDIMSDYINNPQARGNINSVVSGNSNYNSLFQAIKSYWTKQIPILKNKPKDKLTPEDSSMIDTIESQLKNGDPKEIENYSMKKLLGEHSKEITYQKDKKTIVITGYTETEYDKSIKTK
jgi:hypothetical protein